MDNSDLEILVSRLKDNDPDVQKQALTSLQELIKGTQGSISNETQGLLDIKEEMIRCIDYLEESNKKHLYDLLSVMCVLDDSPASLEYRLNGNVTPLMEWSHQYVKKLVKCIVDTHYDKVDKDDTNCGKNDKVKYEKLIEPIIQFLINHNSEVEAIDFLIEVSCEKTIGGNGVRMQAFDTAIKTISAEETSKDEITEEAKPIRGKKSYFDILIKHVDTNNRNRIVVYLEELSKFYDLKDVLMEITEYDASKHLIFMIKNGMINKATDYVKNMKDGKCKKQCLYILARNSIYYEGKEDEEYILCNNHIKTVYREVGASLEILPPKKLEYMFKGLNKERIDAAAIANALVHFGYRRDPVFFPNEGDFKIKEEYSEQLLLNKSISTVASVGLINAFDPDSVCDFYSQSIFNTPEPGSILALALSSFKNKDSNYTILNLLSIFIGSDDDKEVIAMLMGIAVLYAGTGSQEVYELVFPLLSSETNDVCLFSIYVLGVVFTGDMDILSSCLEIYKELKKESPFANFAILGLSLFFYKTNVSVSNLGAANTSEQNDKASSNTETVQDKLFSRLDGHSKILAAGFAHIGTGNPAVIDHIFSYTFVGEIDALMESLGILSACIVGVGDSVAQHHLDRISSSSLLLDSPHLRNIVPLCIALLYASNPKSEVVDTLEKLINSGDSSINSLISLGIVAAGTCSSRILRILDSNFCNVYKDAKASSALIYAQGLVNLGKGLCTLSPLCYDKQIILQKSLVGLISTFFVFLEPGMFKEYPFLFFLITSAVTPKYVAGFNGVIRIGKPVDVVGVVGRPNKISAAVVHSLPVILNENECADIEEPIYTSYIEDIIIKE